MITSRISGIEQAITITQAIPRSLNLHVQQTFRTVGAESLALMRRLTPVRTGYLRSRDKVKFHFGADEVTMVASNDAPYAKFVCFGTRYMRARDFMTPPMVYGRKKLEEAFKRSR